MAILSVRSILVAALLLLPSTAQAYGPNICDFDNDGIADHTIVRNNGGALQWWVRRSTNGSALVFNWGVTGDVPMCGDFDGDDLDDATVWRSGAQATFWIRLTAGGILHVPFGIAGDDPKVINDFDNDGIDDVAVYRSGAQSYYWVRNSSNGLVSATPWGTTGDKAHAADFDGDGRADLIVQRGTRHWLRSSLTGFSSVVEFGVATDLMSTLDYTGDGRADLTALRNDASNLRWYVRNMATSTVSPFAYAWGPAANRTPVPADWDGDGIADFAVYMTGSGQWWARSSISGFSLITNWGGLAGDIALQGFEIK